MIRIKKSPTADNRTCDPAQVTKEILLESSKQHIADVQAAMGFIGVFLCEQAERHDLDKISDIDGFHRDFIANFDFKHLEWWKNHKILNRHHLLDDDGIPEDVNLIDVLEMICDCVMAGMARSGSVYGLNISTETLSKAFQNTVQLLKSNVEVVE